jgi:amino acid adenylation domain-containing protein
MSVAQSTTSTSALRRQFIAQRLKNAARRSATKPQALRRRRRTTAPLSYAQQRLWFLEQLDPDQPVYHVHCALRLKGRLQAEYLQAAINRVVERHEALRTTFKTQDGVPMQRVNPPTPLQIEMVETPPEQLAALMQAEASRPFDLERDLMLRAKLFELAADDHVLQFTLHHIASDAWSLDLLINECLTFYQEFSQHRAPSLPALPIQYSDYAVWQRESPILDADVDYWKTKLAGAPETLELPTETGAPPKASSRGATASMLLEQRLLDRLANLAEEHNVTLFMLLLAAFKVLLYRYTGQEDIVVGVPMSRRSEKQTENLVGFFLNTVVLRSDLSGNPCFMEFLRRVRDTVLEGYAHAIPFERLVEELQPERDPQQTPFFQVMFSYEDASRPLLKLESLHVERFEIDLPVAPFVWTLLARSVDGGLSLQLEYKTELFSAQTVERLLGHLRTLLEGIARNPQESVGTLPLLTAVEEEQLLHEFNPCETEYPKDQCIHDLFEAQAARTPDAVALKFGGHWMTYRDLNERTNQLAHYLRTRGVGLESRIAIFTERSFETIIGVLGILKAGAAYVPIEPDEPAERLGLKLRDSKPAAILTQRRLISLLPADHRNIIPLDTEPAIARQPRTNPNSGVSAQNLIYVIYTSGSTGTPKGVMVEHRAIVNHSVGFAQRFDLGSQDRVLQFAPLSFDVSVEEIFPTLISGGTLVLRPAGLAVSIQDFHPFINRENLTILNLPTPYWEQWISEIEQRQLQMPASLRLVVVGSDSVAAEHFSRWKRIAPHIRWCNAYGTTEATITATIYEPEGDETPTAIPIGRPISNTQAYILDGKRQLVPIGVPGEIYIGGVEVARGYLDCPDVERERFIPDPFSGKAGARLNRTGDLGRWRSDGNIEFIGRHDNQVKIRGFRIELGEIESALLQIPWIKAATVVAREDSPGVKRLVAYVVPDENEPHLFSKLQKALQAKLPAYMMPSAFVRLDALPLLPSGKVDRKSLPNPGVFRPELDQEFVPANDSLEEKLVSIWRQVLGVDRVGVNDNFFSLGGHSLLAVRLFAEIEKLTGWNVPLLTLFESPTIRQLADVIRRMQSEMRGSSILAVQPGGSGPPLFLIHGAGGGMLWGYANLAKHLGPDQPVYVFNCRAVDGHDDNATMEGIAAQYVRDLREFQPEGPYYLGGYCFGGEVAFEMAQQLVAQGQTVAMLAIINAMPPNAAFDRISLTPLWTLRFARNSWYWFRYFCRWTPEQRRTFVGRKARALRKRIETLVGLRGGGVADSVEDQIDLSLYPEEQQKLWDVHLRASAQYRPKPYPGHVTVLRTRFHPFFCSFDPAFGWAEFAMDGVTTRIVAGAHESILDEPYAPEAAAALKQYMVEIQGRPAQSKIRASLQEATRVLASSALWIMDFVPAI